MLTRHTLRNLLRSGIIRGQEGSFLLEQGTDMSDRVESSDEQQSHPPSGGGTGAGPAVSQPIDIEVLIEAHHATVYAYAYRLTCSTADAEDLTQQTFLIAYEKSSQIRDPGKSLQWLLAVARTRFLKNRRRRVPVPAVNLDLSMESIPDTTHPLETNWDRELLNQAVAELPDPYRLVIAMFYFEECSYKEIAQQLELPIGTVMSRLARAKGHLRKRLECGQSQAVEEGERN